MSGVYEDIDTSELERSEVQAVCRPYDGRCSGSCVAIARRAGFKLSDDLATYWFALDAAGTCEVPS